MTKPKAEIYNLKIDAPSPVLDSLDARIKNLVRAAKTVLEVNK